MNTQSKIAVADVQFTPLASSMRTDAGKSLPFKRVAAFFQTMFLAIAVASGQASTPKQGVEADLSSPEATVLSFTRAAARGQTDLAQACFLPDGVDYGDIRAILASKPGAPEYEMKQMLQSLDVTAGMPIISRKETKNGTAIVWRVTFKRDFIPTNGPAFKSGSTYDFDATLKKSGNSWLIDNF